MLARAGLNLPTVDIDTFTLKYRDMFDVVHHLRSMAECNAALQRRPGPMPRETSLAAAANYQAMFSDDDGYVTAQFQALYMAGWSYHESQQRPAQRGSAEFSLSEIEKMIDNPEGGNRYTEAPKPDDANGNPGSGGKDASGDDDQKPTNES